MAVDLKIELDVTVKFVKGPKYNVEFVSLNLEIE